MSFANKRLLAEVKQNSKSINPGISLQPSENDLTRWHANVQIRDGPHKGTILHVLFVVDESYPNNPPSAYFPHQVPYNQGATSYTDGLGYHLCLDLLNNWRRLHTDWGNTASGWSPSYTLMTVCIAMQGLLPEMFRDHDGAVRYLDRDSRNCHCDCGHDGPSRKYVPEIPDLLPLANVNRPGRSKNYASAQPSTEKKSLWDFIDSSGNVNEYSRLVPATEEDIEILDRLNKDKKQNDDQTNIGKPMKTVEKKADKESASSSSSASNVSASSSSASSSVRKPTAEEIAAESIRCYAYGSTPATDPEETFGFGILAGVRALSTPSEILSLTAFNGGVRKSSLNTNIDRFLPLYLSDEHWKTKGRAFFESSIPQLYQDLMGDSDSTTATSTSTTIAPDTTKDDRDIGIRDRNTHGNKNSHRRNSNASSTRNSTGSRNSNGSNRNVNPLIAARTRPQIQCLLFLCSLINNTVVGAMSSDTGSASEKFSNGYFALLRLLLWLKRTYPTVVTYADTQIERFLASPYNRTKSRNNGVPNLGDFLVLLHVSEKYTWDTVGPIFMEECDARNVRWYLRELPELEQLTPRNPDRLALTFETTAVSRNLICFQTGFLTIAKSLDLSTFSDMCAPTTVCDELRSIHKKAAALKDWAEFFAQNKLRYVSDQVRYTQLENAVKSSAHRKYHGNT